MDNYSNDPVERLEKLNNGIKEYGKSLEQVLKENSIELGKFPVDFLRTTRWDMIDGSYYFGFRVLHWIKRDLEKYENWFWRDAKYIDASRYDKLGEWCERIIETIDDTGTILLAAYWNDEPTEEEFIRGEENEDEFEESLMKTFKDTKNICLENALILGEGDLNSFILYAEKDNEIEQKVDEIQKMVRRRLDVMAILIQECFR